MTTTTVEEMAAAFKEMGTPFIVGHPGGESVELMEAAKAEGMRFILMKQEVAGAMLAATWGEITGSPGVCLSTRGPGATNMVNGIAHAFLDRAPLIAITDRYSAPEQAIGIRQRLDHQAVLQPIVKWSTAIDASVIKQQLRRAVRIATGYAPGPVHFDLPQSETKKTAGSAPNLPNLMPNYYHPKPDPRGLDDAVAMIKAANRPVLLVGLGALWDGACPAMVALAEHLGAPVLTTSKCKGAIPEDHPLRAGCIIGGLIERDLVSKADLIITIGLDAVELQPKGWPYETKVLSFANHPSLDGLVACNEEVIGNLHALMTEVRTAVPQGSGGGFDAAKEFRDRVHKALDTPATGLSPQWVVERVREIMPRDTVATCDAGASRLLVVQKWQSYGAREFLTSNGLGSMGFAIPGALAARLAHPDRPVVAFTGDGGMLMAVADIQTSVREKLPIIILVFDDGEVGLIRTKQSIKGIDPYGVHIGGIDWEHLARGFGANGTNVDTEAGLISALDHALKSNETTVIGVKIDASGYVDQFNALREL
ncbi:MAG: thiamine pyrophosphate-binding protein [Candidatus Puniceispirillaceae bacterium]